MLNQISQGAAVHYRRQIINSDGTPAGAWSPWKKNLLLNAGLDFPAVHSWPTCFRYIALGDGTTPVKRDSGATTFTRSGNVVTASNSFFEAADATSGGRLLKFDTGEEMTVTAFGSATSVTVDTSGTLGASEGTIWYVNETGHGAEFTREGGYSTSAGENVSTFSGNTWTHRRTFLTANFAASKVVREIGWTPDAPSGNLFGRDLVPGGGDSMAAGQKYKVQVELSVSYSPSSATAVADVGNNGFNTAGEGGIEMAVNVVSRMWSNGGNDAPNGVLLEPACGPMNVFVSDGALPIQPMSTANSLGPNSTGVAYAGYAGCSKAAYISGSRYIQESGTLDENSGNSTGLRSLMWADSYLAYRVLLTTAQTKDSLHTLTLVFRLSWNRVLTN